MRIDSMASGLHIMWNNEKNKVEKFILQRFVWVVEKKGNLPGKNPV